ncbi:MAG: 50S ribosomal protein L11 methyltransferase [Desulfuromonas sp.]|nr:MAG: 50S ribosomal protein L11 methyltransferase [Desulfuromonas sp.]
MDKKWLAFEFNLPNRLLDDVGGVLQDLDCQGVVTAPWISEDQLLQEPSADDAQRVTAYFPGLKGDDTLRDKVLDRLVLLVGVESDDFSFDLQQVPVDESDWTEGWKQYFSPMRIGPLLVRPSWWEDQVEQAPLQVVIDPGMAFGTGSHATTRLCLQALVGLCKPSALPCSLLDVGTGSGILAIAAARLGIRRVVACDNDPVACETAADNVLENDVAERVELTGLPLGEIVGRFEVVLANILAETNIALAPELVRHLAPGGTLVLSGILHEQEADVAAAFVEYPLSVPAVFRDEEWSALVFHGPDK